MNTKNKMLILLLIGLFISCEKLDSVEVPNSNNQLIGKWLHTESIPSGLSDADFRYFDVEQIFKVNSDATYSQLVNFYGFEDEDPDEIIGQSETLGTYEIRADSVFLKGTKNTSWEKGFNPEPTTTTLNGEAYGSRFEIIDDTLTLYYISYPADAPQQTQMSYTKAE